MGRERNESRNSDDCNFDSSGGRPTITVYGAKGRFRPGDNVMLSVADSRAPLGPYLIEEYRGEGKYVLASIQDGTLVNDGAEVEEKDLTLVE